MRSTRPSLSSPPRSPRPITPSQDRRRRPSSTTTTRSTALRGPSCSTMRTIRLIAAEKACRWTSRSRRRGVSKGVRLSSRSVDWHVLMRVPPGWYDSADAEYLEPEDGARGYSSSHPAAGGKANDYSDGHDQQYQQRPQQYQHYSAPGPNLGGTSTRHQHQQQPDSGAPLLRTAQPVPVMTSSRFTHWTELSTVHSVGSYLEARDAHDGDAHSRGPSSGSSAHTREGSELRSRRREASEAQRGHDGEDHQPQHLNASGSNHEGDGQNGVGWLGGWWRG